MCSTNVVFNMKTVKNFFFLSRISSFEEFLEPIFSKFFSLNFFNVA